MATSPNFNWPEPDNTDLVKNGALAIRTAVNAIDTSMAELKGGTTGQVLSKTSATDMDFTWTTPSGGKIVQVVSASYSTPTTSTSGTFVDTGLTATITPTSASNTILVMVAQNGLSRDATSATQCMGIRLVRGSTTIAKIAQNLDFSNSILNHYFGTASINYVDSPATTSATTYKTTFNQQSGTGTMTTQIDNSVSTIILMEVSA
jgi:hypothetical protein